jgi:dipeptidyl aminopeptidase/acylaminoacyl peptidase
MNQETVDDAVRGAALLREDPAVDPGRVFVLGHSQGGYMMPRILERASKVAGAIILAGNVRSIQELLGSQIAYLKGDPADAAKLLKSLPSGYLADLAGYDPTSEAKRIELPLLILQGERDYQVTMQDFSLWKAALGASKNVMFRSYPALNHLFIVGEGESTPAEYQKAGHVDRAVVEDIANWILEARSHPAAHSLQ